jgi:naphthoate synthase
LAPLPCSSGGRSAVITSIPTPEWKASSTAGWRLAAAVPEVQATTAGRPVRDSPSARNPADRSSIRTCMVSRPSSAAWCSAMDSAALREPGQTTTWRTPLRTSSSTITVACAVDGFTGSALHAWSYARDVAVSEIFDPSAWSPVDGFDFTDITYHRAVDTGAVRIAFDRPDVRNAFRPHTVDELYRALDHARMSPDVGCVLLTGNGPSTRDGGWAFCSGGDQRIRGRTGYQYASGEDAASVDPARAGRLHILECQRLIRFMPKVVIAVVPGWAAGGGHSLHVTCDLTIASAEHARFKQTDSDVGSFDGGYGSAYLARQVGQKFAREIFFLGRSYSAEDMHRMGAVNAVVPHADLEATALEWAREINGKSPTAQRMLKYAFNLIDDGLVGQQLFAGESTRLAYMTDEAVEGRDAFLEKRPPDWSPYPYYY